MDTFWNAVLLLIWRCLFKVGFWFLTILLPVIAGLQPMPLFVPNLPLLNGTIVHQGKHAARIPVGIDVQIKHWNAKYLFWSINAGSINGAITPLKPLQGITTLSPGCCHNGSTMLLPQHRHSVVLQYRSNVVASTVPQNCYDSIAAIYYPRYCHDSFVTSLRQFCTFDAAGCLFLWLLYKPFLNGQSKFHFRPIQSLSIKINHTVSSIMLEKWSHNALNTRRFVAGPSCKEGLRRCALRTEW